MPNATRACPACRTPLPDASHFCLNCGAATPTEPGVPPRLDATGAVEVSRVRVALGDRYQVERILGEGGMATVYLATDTKHRRKVAVKVMRPQLAATLGADRFLREVEIAAQLSHPHILPMYDSGESGGVLFYVMPYIDGESLQARMRREGQLPVEDAVRLAREVAEALSHAHERGIIHRDIKPANILLSAGHALVADFGIARALGAGGEALTQTGLAVGTPHYMSPEQAMGGADVDARADIYAVGAMLYEMLAGEPPFTGPSAQAIMTRSLTETARPLTQSRPSLPAGVAAAVSRALSKTAADRQATSAHLAADLAAAMESTRSGAAAPVTTAGPSPLLVWGLFGIGATASLIVAAMLSRQRGLPFWTIGLAVGLLVIGAVVLIMTGRSERARAGGATQGIFGRMLTWTNAAVGGFLAMALWGVVAMSLAAGGGTATDGGVRLAVLPFTNRGAADDAYFVDGVADQIRGTLGNIGGFQVIARTSSDQYRGTTKGTAEIGRELGVDYLLSATVSWVRSGGSGGRVQVLPELIEVRTGAVKWQQPFDADLTDVFEVQADIARRVSTALNIQLGAGGRDELARKPTANLGAWDTYLKAKAAANAAGGTNATVERELLERAVALDSNFALAWADLSRVYSRVYFSIPTRAAADASRRAADRAMALAPDAPETALAVGTFHLNVMGDVEGGLAALGEGMRRHPNHVGLLTAEAAASRMLGRWEEVVAIGRKVARLDPKSPANSLATALLWLRRYPEAMEEADRILVQHPTLVGMWHAKAMIALAQGDLPRARAVLAEATRVTEPIAVAAHVSLNWDTYWALPDDMQSLVLRLPMQAFANDDAGRANISAALYYLRGDPARSRIHGDSAVRIFRAQLDDVPDDNYLLVLYGLAQAYAGRFEDAIRAGERAVALLPISRDAFSGPYNAHQLARIYTLAGKPEQALDQLEAVLAVPYFISPGWLRVDPTWDALRGNPRFQRLAAGP